MADLVLRTTRYRLVPGTVANARFLAQTAGATRYVWNHLLARYQAEDAAHKNDASDRPSLHHFGLNKWYRELKETEGHEWLHALSSVVVRHAAKRLADAFKAHFNGDAAFPVFHGRRGDDSFTIPQDAKLRDGKLYIPKCGWMVVRRKGADPHAHGTLRTVTVKCELGRWYAYLVWRVPDPRPADNGRAVGVDMNAGQVATSNGDLLRLPEVGRLEARYRRHQRRMARQRKGSNRRKRTKRRAAKVMRRLREIRRNWQHQVSHRLASEHGTVVVEDLKTKGMTKGGGRRKRGLNRVILATGWRGLRDKLAYKVANLIEVDPAYTSQRCSRCGYTVRGNRRSQAVFRCLRCGHESNADVNAALNILASGVGAAARGGALPLGTPAIREIELCLSATSGGASAPCLPT